MKMPLVVSLVLLAPMSLFAQKSTPISAQNSMSAFCQGYIGELQFSAAAISVNAEAEPAYIGFYPYILSPRSKLFLTVFLSTSLTQSLQRFVPHVPLKELARSGTFQFSFYVDAQLIYLSNLPLDALSPESRKSETRLHQALVNPGEPVVEWGQLLWDRFLSNGGVRALAPGRHLLRIEIRPYFQDSALRDAPVLAAGQVALDVTHTLAPHQPAR